MSAAGSLPDDMQDLHPAFPGAKHSLANPIAGPNASGSNDQYLRSQFSAVFSELVSQMIDELFSLLT